MSEPPYVEVSVEPPVPGKASFLRRGLPYIAVLLLTVFGVAYTSMAREPLVGFWEVLAVAVGILCVTTKWPSVSGQGRVQLIWKQTAHWAAVLFAMNIVLYSSVLAMLNTSARGVTILLLLALGTLLAGINTSLQIVFLGLSMALAVPAIAWFKQSALLLFLTAAAVTAIGFAFAWWRR